MSSELNASVALLQRTARALELVSRPRRRRSFLGLPDDDRLAWIRAESVLEAELESRRAAMAARCEPWFDGSAFPKPATNELERESGRRS
jgi:hypothetical protein